ncbi:MAG: PhzF family phenazine biosynthesis isomerase [Pseudomonadota bacterium]
MRGSIEQPLHLAAFCRGNVGGNPAGVVFAESFFPDAVMQSKAKQLGYSETAFVIATATGFAVRYFSPLTEVPFCGHATVAAVAALGERYGEGLFPLVTAAGDIEARATRGEADGQWQGGFVARPASESLPSESLVNAVCAAFALHESDLDQALAPMRVSAGAEHLQLGVASREVLAAMAYPLEQVAALMRDHGLVTINLLWREDDYQFHSRNAFASGGVYEDPATGAAAAALGGYCHKRGLRGAIHINQGDDMGVPCRIGVVINDSAPLLEVNGFVRTIAA